MVPPEVSLCPDAVPNVDHTARGVEEARVLVWGIHALDAKPMSGVLR
jgi:hypothetical protein